MKIIMDCAGPYSRTLTTDGGCCVPVNVAIREAAARGAQYVGLSQYRRLPGMRGAVYCQPIYYHAAIASWRAENAEADLRIVIDTCTGESD